ncbi:MAG TPA: dockerin type I repeat-containing protein [Tepidisphaeraceae bacterium]|jgi:hypothetical protein|nr:dockerin type I repeat-containing protein [Tepidisphaeraceae bacterium]
MHMFRTITRCLLLCCATALPASATVVYSDLGPNNAYDTTSFQTLSQPYDYAVSFVPTKTVSLASITLPLIVVGSPQVNAITLTLLTTNPSTGLPVLTAQSPSFTISNLINYSQNDGNGALYTVTPTSLISLTAGQTYWILATAPSGTEDGWFDNYTRLRDNYLWTSDNGASWQKYTPENISGGMTITGYLPGDLNDDGVINSDDFALIDRGFAKHLTGYSNGDLNFDGVVNSQDYLLLDTDYLHQASPSAAAQLLSDRESQFGPAYVSSLLTSLPEPATLTLLTLFPLLRRRTK